MELIRRQDPEAIGPILEAYLKLLREPPDPSILQMVSALIQTNRHLLTALPETHHKTVCDSLFT